MFNPWQIPKLIADKTIQPVIDWVNNHIYYPIKNTFASYSFMVVSYAKELFELGKRLPAVLTKINQNVWITMNYVFNKLGGYINDKLNSLSSLLQGLINQVKQGLNNSIQYLKKSDLWFYSQVSNIYSKISIFTKEIYHNIPGYIDNALIKTTNFLTKYMDKALAGINKALNIIGVNTEKLRIWFIESLHKLDVKVEKFFKVYGEGQEELVSVLSEELLGIDVGILNSYSMVIIEESLKVLPTAVPEIIKASVNIGSIKK